MKAKIGSVVCSMLVRTQVSAVLGDMEKTGGTVRTTGSIAYVAQSAWIINATVRGNITFGKPFDQARYNAVVEATSLEHDFKVRQKPTVNYAEAAVSHPQVLENESSVRSPNV